MRLIETHHVPKLETPTRLQEYGVNIFVTVPSKSGLKKAIKKGLVKVNGKAASTALFITGNETIELYQSLTLPKALEHLDFPLEVLFEDDYLAIIYKPPGVLVNGNTFVTIYNALPQNLKLSSQNDAIRPLPIHRLDYPTSGVLLIGKTSACSRKLYKLFEHKTITKTYHAITIGSMPSIGHIESPIDGKNAYTSYTVLQTETSERFEALNLVELNPKTGRRHQLRKHLHSIGHPILGDKTYYIDGRILKGNGVYLHASNLAFTHPITQEHLSISKELPKKFRRIFKL